MHPNRRHHDRCHHGRAVVVEDATSAFKGVDRKEFGGKIIRVDYHDSSVNAVPNRSPASSDDAGNSSVPEDDNT